MNNSEFLVAIEHSFEEFIASGTSRSTRKLIPLHGAIAYDMSDRFGHEYGVQSQGFAAGKEGFISGRYLDKKVDITITQHGKPIGGIAVKFVMQNYAQNANNYFESMLGETANIRSVRCPYFQVFVIPDKLPYYKKGGEFQHWESFSKNNLRKYMMLDGDDPRVHFHTPDKMLIYVIHLPDIGDIHDKEEYRSGYAKIIDNSSGGGYVSTVDVAHFSNSVILNDYECFAEKVYHSVLAR